MNDLKTPDAATLKRAPGKWSKLLFMAALLATLLAVFYTVENWRGHQAWERCRQELLAKGCQLDYRAFVPTPVADDSNFLKVGPIQNWFRKEPKETNSLSRVPKLPGGLTSIPPTMEQLRDWNAMLKVVLPDSEFPVSDRSISPAAAVLKWLERYHAELAMFYEAAQRPQARFDFDYSRGIETEIPQFVRVRSVSQVLTTHAKASLLAGRPEDAMLDLTVICRLMQAMKSNPTLVGAMIGVAIGGLYTDVVQDGLAGQLWKEPQLLEIQSQLRTFNFLSDVDVAMRGGEMANVLRFLDESPRSRLLEILSSGIGLDNLQNVLFFRLAPRGWRDQNMAAYSQTVLKGLAIIDAKAERVYPAKDAEAIWSLDGLSGPYRHIARLCIPNFIKAFQRSAQNQTMAKLAEVACALERYRSAQGKYPKDLEALAPTFIPSVPRDMTTGDPLIYRATENGSYQLYSRAWDMADNGGGKEDWAWNAPEIQK